MVKRSSRTPSKRGAGHGGHRTPSDKKKLSLEASTSSKAIDNSLLESSSESAIDSDDDMADLKAARTRLSKALEQLVNGERVEPQEEEDETDHSMSPPSKVKRRSLANKSRVKTEATHTTKPYDVSFFDRKVDIAPIAMRLTPGSAEIPLYMICRDWIRDGRGSEVPSLRKHLSRENETLDAEKGAESGVRRLPDPLPIKRDKYAKHDSVRIPKNTCKPIVNVYEIDEAINSSEDMGQLLALNLTKWKKIRNDWRQAALENEQRYKHSCDVLKAMYEKSLSAQTIEPKLEPMDP